MVDLGTRGEGGRVQETEQVKTNLAGEEPKKVLLKLRPECEVCVCVCVVGEWVRECVCVCAYVRVGV